VLYKTSVGLLKDLSAGTEVALRSRCLVGRSPGADIRLSAKGSSSEHASIYWDNDHWVIRDLTSRNGTKINGTLMTGLERHLSAGDTIIFGDPAERWLFADNGPPQAVAHREDGVVVIGRDGLLCLPNWDEPLASIYLGKDEWEIDVGGAARPVRDQEIVEMGEHRFRLNLPSNHLTTNRTGIVPEDRSVASAQILFHVSRDEEFVAIDMEVTRVKKELDSRAFHYMLLLLARARQSEQLSGMPNDEAGWLYADDVAKKLGTTPEKLNVDICRARQLVAKTKLVDDPDAIVQRRRSTSQIRLGVSDIIIDGSFSPGSKMRHAASKTR
jgi:hypothetical protein